MTLSWTCLEKQRKIVCLSATEKIIARRRLPPHFYQRLACLHDVVMLELSTARFNKAKSSTLSISAFQPNDLSGWEINAPVGKLEVLSISRGWWELKGVQEGTLWVGVGGGGTFHTTEEVLCVSIVPELNDVDKKTGSQRFRIQTECMICNISAFQIRIRFKTREMCNLPQANSVFHLVGYWYNSQGTIRVKKEAG